MMDEQPHRRRRQRTGEAQQTPFREESAPQRREEPTDGQGMERESFASGDEQAHHRRRRAVTAQEAPENGAADKSPSDNDDVFWHPYEQENQQESADEKRSKRATPIQAVSALDNVICKIGDFCLAALKWIGVGLLFVAGFLADCAKKLIARAKPALSSTGRKAARSGAVHTGKHVLREKKAQARDAEVTLVPTRPEDYRGIAGRKAAHHPHAQQRIAKRVVRAPRNTISLAYSAAMAVLICIALLSAYMVGSILWRSISTKRLSESLSERYSELSSEWENADDEDDAQRVDDMIVFAQEATPAPVDEYPVETEEAKAQEEIVVQATAEPKKKEAVLTTKFHQVGGDALPEMEALYQDNRDLIGWLRMEGILDLPVVYRDNEYYLTRDFYKNKSASGTLFLDENHPFKEKTQNLLLHGHNMKDGTMFGRLVQYETNLQFLKNNPFIQYSTLWRKEQYVIFSVMHVSLDVRSEDFFNYFTHPTFSSDTQFENYVRALQNRSTFSIPVDVDSSDALLTLSTCLDEDRLVIVARRLREGESKSELRHLVQLADRQ